MAPVDWRQAWKAGVTPWDAGASPPALRGLLDRGAVPSGRVLVPGCGTGYYLAQLMTAGEAEIDMASLDPKRFGSWMTT